MFLFLDVASPIPEFHIINEKKIIDSIKIINNINQKLSDQLIPTYLNIDSTYKLTRNVKKLIITIGPGSYTALRVGASFIAGLSQSMNLPVSVISTQTIYQHFYDSSKKIGIYFKSSNNQKFFSYQKNLEFIHEKIDSENYTIPKSISIVLYNCDLPKFIDINVKSEAFSVKMNIIQNIDKLKFNKNLIINPIYISNNSILN